MLPWHKAPNKEVLVGMGANDYPAGWKVPRYLAKYEGRAIIAYDCRDEWSISKLAKRWGWSESSVGRLLRFLEEEAQIFGGEAKGERVATEGEAKEQTAQRRPRLSANGGAAKGDRRDTEGDADSLARARSIPELDAELDAEPHPPSPLSEGERAEAPKRQAPTQPNFSRPEQYTPQQPPGQLADRVAFVERWNLYAEEFYPGQPSQRWESTTLSARRGHRAGGFFASPRDEAKEQAMLEFGPHLLPMLDRYAECCRGEHGPEAVRAFERGDFEGRRLLAAMHLWVTTGKAPHWVKADAVRATDTQTEWDGETPIFRYVEQS